MKKLIFLCGRKIRDFVKFILSLFGRYAFAFFVYGVLGIVVFFVRRATAKGM